MFFSIIVPVYNRPEELAELLESLCSTTFKQPFEVIIIEDGSTIDSKDIVSRYKSRLDITYYFKKNTGPGDSRNFGMKQAKGDYFIIFDSDCIIPPDYLSNVAQQLKSNDVACFGGPDKALATFSTIQKAINFAMTSFLTTGGIRGSSEKLHKFQPRSFNMGLSKKAFLDSKGFGFIHPGEDPDLSMRLWKMGYETRLFSDCFVYHKRRIDWAKFSLQVAKFGKARPILNSWHPEYAKLTFWFPSLFIIGLLFSVVLLFFLIDLPLKMYFIYFVLVFITSAIANKSLLIGLYSIKAVFMQFFGYGIGFMKSFVQISILNKNPEVAFPELFFKKTSKTKVIGLTGGIGSGKTTVASFFTALGIPVYISDNEAKKVMETPLITNKIVAAFGQEVVDDKNLLKRDVLASIVFKAPEKLKELNAIVHPEVKKHFDLWVESHPDAPFIIKETAILFESGSNKLCDKIITVTAPLESRIDRVVARDKTTRAQVLARIQSQISDDERASKSDYVIDTTNFEATKQKVEAIASDLATLHE